MSVGIIILIVFVVLVIVVSISYAVLRNDEDEVSFDDLRSAPLNNSRLSREEVPLNNSISLNEKQNHYYTGILLNNLKGKKLLNFKEKLQEKRGNAWTTYADDLRIYLNEQEEKELNTRLGFERMAGEFS